MDRRHFLDAQLWMRRAAPGDWITASSSTDEDPSGAHTRSLSLQLLPPAPASAHPIAAAEGATAWCCFHVGSRYCLFRAGGAGEDQTQFQFELMLRNESSAERQLLARFDGEHVYAVDPRQVLDIVLPRPPLQSTGAQPVTQQQQYEAPPFGCLEFQNVSLRIWMDLPHGNHSLARQMLQNALVRVQKCALNVRGHATVASHHAGALDDGSSSLSSSSWKDAFRHSEWLVSGNPSDALPSSLASLQTTPSEFLKRARRILKKDADFEAVKVTCWKIFRANRSFPRRRKHSEGDDAQMHECLSEMDLILLLAELAHIFGEEHDGVNELLGFRSSAACGAHDRCYELHPERVTTGNGNGGEASSSPATCVTSKWQAWDEYLEVSAQVSRQSSRRKEYGGGDSKYATIHAAAAVFQHAIVGEADASSWRRRTKIQRDQICAYERVGFSAFFPDRSKRRRHEESTVAPDANARVQQQLKAEQVLAVLLEKRRQLVRDELALSLLPRRAPSEGVN